MVQWFKSLWKRVTYRKPSRLLDFNKEALTADMHHLGESLYEFRDEMSFKIIQEVIQLARNIQILDVNAYRTIEELKLHQGRLQAFDDLLSYLDRVSTFDPEKDKKESGAKHGIRAFRRRTTTNQAGAAV